MSTPDPLHGAIQFHMHRIALALHERGVDHRRWGFSRHARAGRSLRPMARQQIVLGASRKSRRATSRLRATGSIAGQQRACRQSLSLGKPCDEPSSPAFTTGPSTAILLKIIGMFRSALDTSIKRNSGPRKSRSDFGNGDEARRTARCRQKKLAQDSYAMVAPSGNSGGAVLEQALRVRPVADALFKAN